MTRMVVLILLGCALVGCSGVGSVYPIYTPDDKVCTSQVLGTWTDKDAKGILVISSEPQGGCRLQFREDDGQLNTLDLHLAKIGDTLFADVTERGDGKDAPLSMPMHVFAKVEVSEQSIKLFFPNAKWFESRLDRHPSAIHHIKRYEKGGEGWIYLTDGTKQVRSFLKKCAKSPEAFVEDINLKRISNSQELPPEKPAAVEENKEGQETGK